MACVLTTERWPACSRSALAAVAVSAHRQSHSHMYNQQQLQTLQQTDSLQYFHTVLRAVCLLFSKELIDCSNSSAHKLFHCTAIITLHSAAKTK